MWNKGPTAKFAKAAAIFTYAFLYIPVIVLVAFSFSGGDVLGLWGGFSLKWYKKLFSDHTYLDALATSVRLGICSGLLATGIAGLFAFAQMRLPLNRLWERAMEIGLIAVLISPEIINGLSLLVAFNISGLALGQTTLLFAHTMLNLPLAWLILVSRMKAIPKEWEEAAMDLGANFWRSVKHITLPLLAPALVSSFLVTFSYSFDDFVTSLFVSGPGSATVPLKAYSILRYSPSPTINALSALLFFVPLILVGTSGLLLWRRGQDFPDSVIATPRLKSGLAMTAGIGLVLLFGGCAKTPTLSLYGWSESISPELVRDFEKAFHCRVTVDNAASNEELFAKLKNIDPKRQIYDVVVPSDYMVSILISEGLLEELPPKETALANWKHLDERYVNLYFDPGNRFSVPYQIGMTGLAWNAQRTLLDEKEISWKLMLDPRFKGKTSLLNDVREAFALGLRLLGQNPNETNPAVIAKAAEILRQIKNSAATVNSENVEYLLLTGDVALAHAWNTAILKLKVNQPELRFAVPREGGVVWMDNMAIAKGSKNKDLAVAFINYFLDPEVALKNMLYVRHPSPNLSARELLPAELKVDPAFYPPESLLGKLEWLKDLGPETTSLYERFWVEIKGE